jgi:hypothetical protein
LRQRGAIARLQNVGHTQSDTERQSGSPDHELSAAMIHGRVTRDSRIVA